MISLPLPLWLWGSAGSGVSTMVRGLAEARGVGWLDDVDQLELSVLEAWLREHPRGVLGAHRAPPAVLEDRVLVWALPSLADHPEALPEVLQALAKAEGLEGPLPAALSRPPCPLNLRAAHNRILRWKLLGQLPEPPPSEEVRSLPLEEDNLALNLHALERLLLHRALRRAYGNRLEATRRLGISRRQIYLLIARHGDPLRGDAPLEEGPQRLQKAKARQNSSDSD